MLILYIIVLLETLILTLHRLVRRCTSLFMAPDVYYLEIFLKNKTTAPLALGTENLGFSGDHALRVMRPFVKESFKPK